MITTRFATLKDAKLKGAFDRGWLPPELPDSARSIVGKNNLDLNTGTGSFEYDLSEKTLYLERLIRAGATLSVEQDTDILTLITNGSRWELRLPRNAGQARWSVRLLSL